MSNQKIVEAILAINPQAQFSCGGGNIDNIKWLNETAPISKADIAAKQAELQVAYDNNQYQRDRAAKYPSLKDFAEAYTEKEILADTTKWYDYVVKYNKVRSDNPKS